MNKKMTLLAGAICSALSGAALAGIDDIIITEYVEGSGNNKAIEITNIHTTELYELVTDDNNDSNDLSLYYESYSTSGGGKYYVNQIRNNDSKNVLTGITLKPGQSLVVIHAGAKNKTAMEDNIAELNKTLAPDKQTQIVYSKSSGFNSLNYSGRNPVWLGTLLSGNTSGTDDTTRNKIKASIKDIFGTFGFKERNGSSYVNPWKDQTLRRKTANQDASSAAYDAAHWDKFGKDIITGLGHPTKVYTPQKTQPCTDATSVTEKNIGQVQGTGFKSPLIEEGFESANEYRVTGVVSAITKGGTIGQGFYLLHDDGDETTSNGIFVETSANTDELKVGQQVCVVAKVKEVFGMTTLIPVNDKWEVKNSTPVSVTPVALKRFGTDADSDDEVKDNAYTKAKKYPFRLTLERLEGMPVKLVEDMDAEETGKQNMRVTRPFSFDYDSFRSNMVLAYKRPNPHPNQKNAASSPEAKAQYAQNRDYRLYVESDVKAKDGKIPYYENFAKSPKNNYIRIDDSVKGLEGILHYSHDNFRLVATNTLTSSNFYHNLRRDAKPKLNQMPAQLKADQPYSKADSFNIRVATQNVLNYFNSPFGGADNPRNDNRGAESQLEFERQQTKIVEAIYNLNADIIGLMEIENNGFGDLSAIHTLLRELNKKYDEDKYHKRHYANSAQNRYVFVGFDQNGDTILDDQDFIGGDVITSALIYRPSKVAVVSGQVIPMPEQHAPVITDKNGDPLRTNSKSSPQLIEDGNNYQRNTIAATFKVLNTGKQITVAVNHLKSKGSPCYEDWKDWQNWERFDISKQRNNRARDFDHQGHCEQFRVAATYHLGEEMAKIPGDQILLGDMNSYANEDPMLVLTKNPTGKKVTAAGYTFIGKRPLFGPEGKEITKTFGYLNAVDLMTPAGETSWSYAFGDQVGSLDHLLINPSLKGRLIDAVDLHINAPESPLFDYKNYKKGGSTDNGGEANPFFSADAFRSSDHDSAIISLGYKYNEAGENPITVAIKSGRADIGYPVPATAKKGDIATLTISPVPENAPVIPKVTLDKGDAQLVMFDASNLPTGKYTLTMQLTRPSAAAASRSDNAATGNDEVIDTKTMEVELIKRDSANVKPVYPETDGSGGSFGFGALFTMLGLGFLRRRRQS